MLWTVALNLSSTYRVLSYAHMLSNKQVTPALACVCVCPSEDACVRARMRACPSVRMLALHAAACASGREGGGEGYGKGEREGGREEEGGACSIDSGQSAHHPVCAL